MKAISEKDQDNVEVSMKDQMKKFLIKSLYGFLTVLMFGLGRRTGILDYLLEKAKKQSNTNKISSITFAPSKAHLPMPTKKICLYCSHE